MKISFRPFFEAPSFNYLIRLVEKTKKVNWGAIRDTAQNWRAPSEERIDEIIKICFPNSKRSYFTDQDNIHSLERNYLTAYNEVLQEKAKLPNIHCFAFSFNVNEYFQDDANVERFKSYYYVDLTAIKTTDKGFSSYELQTIVQAINSFSKKDKIIGFKFNSKFISDELHYTNVVILDNNEFYDILTKKLYLDNKTFYHN